MKQSTYHSARAQIASCLEKSFRILESNKQMTGFYIPIFWLSVWCGKEFPTGTERKEYKQFKETVKSGVKTAEAFAAQYSEERRQDAEEQKTQFWSEWLAEAELLEVEIKRQAAEIEGLL